MFSVAFSRRLAVVGGLLLPILETARRWREWPGSVETWRFWMDDYLLGAFLLGAAWLSRPRPKSKTDPQPEPGRLVIRRLSWLTAAWGFACGLGFGSTLAQLGHIINPSLGADPSGIAHHWMTLIKATLVAIAAVGLFASMRDEP